MIAISIDNVFKTYKKVQALKGVSLEIRKGEFFGLLGPNGAGKTTLIKTIVGLARATSGSARVFGMDVEFQGGYYGLSRKERKERAQELMSQFGLTEKAEDEYWKLSGGLQKRVLVARSLMSRPKILILDEPTAGVDVEQRHELWAYLKGLNRDRTTIVMTTHYIDEAEELCERVGIIDFGKIIEIGPPHKLIERHCERYFKIRGEQQKTLNGFGVDEVEVHRGSLEEVFLKLTGKSIHTDETKGQSKERKNEIVSNID